MKFSDLEFDKIKSYDPFNVRADKNGMVTEWVARNSWGNSVAIAYTRGECEAQARIYCKNHKDD